MFGEIGFPRTPARRHVEAKNHTTKSKPFNNLRYRLFAIVAMSSALPAQAATFNVNLAGKVSEIAGAANSFTDAAPFDLFDVFSLSAVFNATAATSSPDGPDMFRTVYHNTLVSLNGRIGDYAFSKSTSASAVKRNSGEWNGPRPNKW